MDRRDRQPDPGRVGLEGLVPEPGQGLSADIAHSAEVVANG